jgi:hypothetical protein
MFWDGRLPRRPLLRTVQNPQDLYFFMNFVDRNERETDEAQLASSLDAAGASTVRKGVERADAFDDCLRYATCGDRAGFGDVVTDSLEIVGSVRSPTDAHQPR